MSLTHRLRDADGDAAMCQLREWTASKLDRLMQLEAKGRRARWRVFGDREAARAWLRTEARRLVAG